MAKLNSTIVTGNLNVTGTITNTAITQLQEKIGSIDISNIINLEGLEVEDFDLLDIANYGGKTLYDSANQSILYPLNYVERDEAMWFEFGGSTVTIHRWNNLDDEPTYSYLNAEFNDITKVIANPTLAGTESALTGLQVGSTKYKVSGGTQLYRHDIVVDDINNIARTFIVYAKHSSPFTIMDDFNDTNILKVTFALSMEERFDIISQYFGSSEFTFRYIDALSGNTVALLFDPLAMPTSDTVRPL